MAHIHKILVPCDGSPASIAALSEALELASDLGATVDLLEVRAPDGELAAPLPAAAGADAAEERSIEEAIAAAKNKLGEQITRRTETGDPARAIVETASDHYDLIVMGTHGRVGRLHSLLGSVAESVVRNAPCPVLTVRASTGDEESFAERIHRTKSIGEQTRPR